MGYTCLVCNYDGLFEQPYTNGIASDEICPCCGFQYGYDDFDKKNSTFEEWRNRWIEEGCKWYSRSRKVPDKWDANEQLNIFRKTE
ncbi:hypothetical protein JYG23_04340 [Sedimentibacter sp. zth1]|uniref:hypothetical protein n=1 Tax=Sedimentibacter sp. zth1 TaxID=2816908 RepID=UPI001A91D19C|nr:hypothetical protein [Sedimentibacter sp. zth1]QSX06690.1 hypothetical protein JYG23_04340 [Sedimentibacter sp. zth1]